MSSLISDLMQRRHQSKSTDRSPSHVFGSEPNFNPLAGARDDAPPKRLRHWLTGSAYVMLSAVIVWQGWLLWESPTSDPQPGQTVQQQEIALDDADDTSAEPAPRSDDESEPSAAASVSPAPLIVEEVDAPPSAEAPPGGSPPEDVAMGTADLPPLTPTAPPSAPTTTEDSEPVTDESPTEASAAAEPAPPSETTGDTATTTVSETSPAPATTRIESADSGAAATATFSSTRRNRELREAQALYQDGQTQQALTQLGAWLRRDDHTDVRQYFARLLLRADRAEEARYVLRPGYSLQELELRAYADFRSDAFSDALRHYSELLRRADTPQAEWYLWAAICHDNLNQSSRAVSMFERYLAEAAGQPDSLLRHARERVDALSG